MNLLPSGQWNQSSVSVSSTISDAGYSLTVNGVMATVNSDGTSERGHGAGELHGCRRSLMWEVQANAPSQMMSRPKNLPSGGSKQFSQPQPAVGGPWSKVRLYLRLLGKHSCN